jgi:hypothetical protein
MARARGEGGPAIASDLRGPWQLSFDPSGNLYVGDIQQVVQIDTKGTLTRVAASCSV